MDKVKQKTIYQCGTCGAQYSQWTGHCKHCGEWNNIDACAVSLTSARISARTANPINSIDNQAVALGDVKLAQQLRMQSGLSELDRVLGGGLVQGTVVLIGGDPGIGKSTLLIQTLAYLSQQYSVLYVSAEESLQQLSLHAKRIGLAADKLLLLAETQLENIIAVLQQTSPQVVVIDSIQAIYLTALQSSAGSVTQVRECAAQLVEYSKRTNTTIFMVGHVTKDGALAGPRVLEHVVDAVLYFEGQNESRFRVIRAMKNRFGTVNELGVFAMTEKGLREVSNPSAIFLSRYDKTVAGSVVMVTWEGTRPLLVEVQSLVDLVQLSHPRRLTLGLEQNRLSMLLAVMHRHGGIAVHDQDVFVNVVGGIRVTETAIDLAVLLSVYSSLRDISLDHSLIVFGEVGLGGEIRPVQSGQERIREAIKHGFKKAIVPWGNKPQKKFKGFEVCAVKSIAEALEACT